MLKLGTALKLQEATSTFQPWELGLHPAAAICCQSAGMWVNEDDQSLSSQHTHPHFAHSHLHCSLLQQVPHIQCFTAFPQLLSKAHFGSLPLMWVHVREEKPGVRMEFTSWATNLNLFWGQGQSPGVQFVAGRGAGVNQPAAPFSGLLSVCKTSSYTERTPSSSPWFLLPWCINLQGFKHLWDLTQQCCVRSSIGFMLQCKILRCPPKATSDDYITLLSSKQKNPNKNKKSPNTYQTENQRLCTQIQKVVTLRAPVSPPGR